MAEGRRSEWDGGKGGLEKDELPVCLARVGDTVSARDGLIRKEWWMESRGCWREEGRAIAEDDLLMVDRERKVVTSVGSFPFAALPLTRFFLDRFNPRRQFFRCTIDGSIRWNHGIIPAAKKNSEKERKAKIS